MDWGKVFGLSVPLVELLVRGTVMFFFLYALAGKYTSVTDAVVLVSTIVAWNWFFDWLAFRFPSVEKWLQPAPLVLVDRGRILWRNMRLELVSEAELRAKIRERGIADLTEVEKALIEPDGQVTVISRRERGTSLR